MKKENFIKSPVDTESKVVEFRKSFTAKKKGLKTRLYLQREKLKVRKLLVL